MSTASEPITAATPPPIAPAAGSAPPALPTAGGEPPFWPISVAMYLQMIRRGILEEQDHVYLWRGRLAALMPPNRPHSHAVKAIYDLIHAMLPAAFDVDREQPLALRREATVPQPDLVIIRGRFAAFRDAFPSSAEVALIGEVSGSSLAQDRKLAHTYAAEGIPVYWLVNLPGRRVEVFTEPAEDAYTRCTPYAEDQEVPVVLDAREVGRIRVRDILPPAE